MIEQAARADISSMHNAIYVFEIQCIQAGKRAAESILGKGRIWGPGEKWVSNAWIAQLTSHCSFHLAMLTIHCSDQQGWFVHSPLFFISSIKYIFFCHSFF